jgi:hypothetical protein
MLATSQSGTKCDERGPAAWLMTWRASIGRIRYIASRAERRRFARNSVWALTLAPAFPRGALTLCPQLCMGITPGRCTEIGLLAVPASSYGIMPETDLPPAATNAFNSSFRSPIIFSLSSPCIRVRPTPFPFTADHARVHWYLRRYTI